MLPPMTLLRLLLAGLLALGVLPCHAGGKKENAAAISFHLEGDAGDNPKMVFGQFVAGRERPFRLVPEVSGNDIAAFNPFPSRNGEGYGVLLQLKPAAKNRYAAITAANQGRWLLARVNGRIVDAALIDRQVADGEIVIWKGVALGDVQLLDKQFPRLGEKKPRG